MQQQSLLKPLVQSLARARFHHYEACRRLLQAHIDQCPQCLNARFFEEACEQGRVLTEERDRARETSLAEKLP